MSHDSVTLRFLGAANTVTGSRYLLSWGERRLLVDCGMFQGYKYLRDRNWRPFPVPPDSIDAIVLTHAHLDHSGFVPALVAQGFRGKVYCTTATAELCRTLWLDAAHLQEEEAKYLNRHKLSKHSPALPLYDTRQAEAALRRLHTVGIEDTENIGDCQVRFHLNGHILGSSSVELMVAGRRLLFSGDLGRPDDPLMVTPAPPPAVDYLVVESTYGDRLHDRTSPEDELAEVINTTVAKGGSVLLPAFAVGRAQLVIYLLRKLQEEKRIPPLPIYLDSPMAIAVTDVFRRHHALHRLTAEQCELMCSRVTYVRSVAESQALNSLRMPRIIISASGMATGGRVLHHLKFMVGDDRNTILFTGYQSGGTRGARLTGGETRIKIHGQYHDVRARIANLENLSAHADYEEVLAWLRTIPVAPKQTFVTHGEPAAADAMRLRIGEELGWRAMAPDFNDEADL